MATHCTLVSVDPFLSDNLMEAYLAEPNAPVWTSTRPPVERKRPGLPRGATHPTPTYENPLANKSVPHRAVEESFVVVWSVPIAKHCGDRGVVVCPLGSGAPAHWGQVNALWFGFHASGECRSKAKSACSPARRRPPGLSSSSSKQHTHTHQHTPSSSLNRTRGI